MIDIKLLRENSEAVKRAISRKKFHCDVDAVLALDLARREKITEAETARARQKAANQEMAKMAKGTPEFLEKVKEMKAVSEEVKVLEAQAKEMDEQFKIAFMTIPNMPHPGIPDGRTEEDNVTVLEWGKIEQLVSRFAVPHYDLPWFEKMIDFPRGVKVTGAGFPFYVGKMSRLVRGLLNFFLDEAELNGYEEVMPPILVNAASATATGQLPDKEGQMYEMPVDGLYAVPTAEVPVTNFFRDEVLEKSMLPLKRVAYTPCFRREAGSWGAHVRGLNRLHQFDKVELVKWTLPEDSFEELEKLRADAERILQKLELPFRSLLMCAGDIGFPHAKQYDLEVWAGGQKRWLEVSSCSNFTDFQARRANIRYRGEDGKPVTVHTLNGSGLAIPRVLAALLENNVQPDGRVKIPSVLHRYCGFEHIGD